MSCDGHATFTSWHFFSSVAHVVLMAPVPKGKLAVESFHNYCVDLRFQKPDDDFETVLANLASDIQKRQLKLSEIRLRERRSTLLVTLYTFAAWGLYSAVWYTGFLGPDRTANSVDRAARAVPVFVGPILCVSFAPPYRTDSSHSVLFIRRIVQVWYSRKGDAEGAWLRHHVPKYADRLNRKDTERTCQTATYQSGRD